MITVRDIDYVVAVKHLKSREPIVYRGNEYIVKSTFKESEAGVVYKVETVLELQAQATKLADHL